MPNAQTSILGSKLASVRLTPLLLGSMPCTDSVVNIRPAPVLSITLTSKGIRFQSRPLIIVTAYLFTKWRRTAGDGTVACRGEDTV